MMAYAELESLRDSWKGEICIFGAGQIGRGQAYEVIKNIGFCVNFYCDNYISEGTVVKDGLRIRGVQYLYDHKEDVLVFLCVSVKYQEQIIKQLKKHKVKNIISMEISDSYIAQIMDEIDKEDDSVKRRWHVFYDDVEFLSPIFKKRTGYDLDIINPKTFNEKIQWLKLYDRNPVYTQMVDKYAVKKYVAEKVGEEYIIPTLGIYDTFNKINFDELPSQFVLKCTHDSGSVVVCDDKKNFDKDKARKLLEERLKINYFWLGREWPYKNVSRRIIAEKYMATSAEMIDYKFMCFHGEPKLIFTCTERFKEEGLKVTFFDLNWNKMNFERYYPSSTKKIERPHNLDLMIKLARKLSSKIPFVRVDLYEIEGRVYFGEMTFSPGGGMEDFRPVEWDYILGEWIKLDEEV